MKDLVKGHDLYLAIALLAVAGIVGLVTTRFSDSPNALPISTVIFLIFTGLAAWRLYVRRSGDKAAANRQAILDQQQHLENLRAQFDVCESAEHLRPELLGFERLTPGFDGDLRRRPFYATYVPRQMVPIDEFGTFQSCTVYSEAQLRAELAEGRDFVLLGPPTMGKSRTLFDIIRGLDGWTVVRPKKDAPTPPREIFEELFSDKQVVLILDDLNDYAVATVDLATFCGPNGLGRAQRWAVAATCRDGPELGAVKNAQGQSLRRFYDQILLKLALTPLSVEEKTVVAASAGNQHWNPDSAGEYPTPGTIVMEDALRFMRGRYEALPGDRRDVLRALKLLTEAGVLPLTHARIQAVVGQVFDREVPHLVDCLTELAADAFLLQPGTQDPVFPEPAYLQDLVVTYAADQTPRDDFPELLRALVALGDAYGLAMLAVTYGTVHGNHERALEVSNLALDLAPGDITILINRATALHALGRFNEALADIDAALQQDPQNPIALLNRGAALGALGRHGEALVDLNSANELVPNQPDILNNRASNLKGLRCLDEALADVDTSLRLLPDQAMALNIRAGILVDLERCNEALADVDMSLRLRPLNPSANQNRGAALECLGRLADAVEAYDKSLEGNPEQFVVLYFRGVALSELGRDTEALASFNAALALNPEDAPALNSRGISLNKLGENQEALKALDGALNIWPDYSIAHYNRGLVLQALGRDEEAEAAFNRYNELTSAGNELEME